jgi:hypothetical protein
MNHFNTKNCLFFLLLLLSIQCKAQFGFNNDDFPEKKGAFFTGGTINLTFGNVTYIDVAPHFGTYITDRISVAGGITYAYYAEKAYNYNYDTYIYGGRVFGRFDILEQLFAHAEMEALNIQNYNPLLPDTKRIWLYSPLAGIGYRQTFSDLSGAYIMLLWNFDETLDYPYGNPMFRIGFEFGWPGKNSDRK